ncbi:MAG TPA: hypothetical protein VJU81_15910 [Methylomirabilota bacterium]|nr:hypothetical protein [Methylomirabilota bacterium]
MSLQGWVPEIGPYLTLAEVIEHAFDYRGNVTVLRRDGSQLVGYLSNRDAAAAEPFVQVIDEQGEGPIRIPYADIANILFTGKDPAEGNSWKAWIERKEREKTQAAPSNSA